MRFSYQQYRSYGTTWTINHLSACHLLPTRSMDAARPWPLSSKYGAVLLTCTNCVVYIHTVQRRARAACANRHRLRLQSQDEDNATSGRCPTIQSPDLYLDPHNVTLHSHTHSYCQTTHRTPTSEFLSRACALHHAGRQGARLNSPYSWPVTAPGRPETYMACQHRLDGYFLRSTLRLPMLFLSLAPRRPPLFRFWAHAPALA